MVKMFSLLLFLNLDAVFVEVMLNHFVFSERGQLVLVLSLWILLTQTTITMNTHQTMMCIA